MMNKLFKYIFKFLVSSVSLDDPTEYASSNNNNQQGGLPPSATGWEWQCTEEERLRDGGGPTCFEQRENASFFCATQSESAVGNTFVHPVVLGDECKCFGDQGFSLAVVQHLFLSFHVQMMMVIIRREYRPQIEPGLGGGWRTLMRSLIGHDASHDISVIQGMSWMTVYCKICEECNIVLINFPAWIADTPMHFGECGAQNSTKELQNILLSIPKR